MRTTASLAAFALTTGLALVPALPASAATAAKPKAVHMPSVKSVTLVTGDVVRVTTSTAGRKAVTLQPRPDGTIPQAAISEANGHLYVVPTAAFGLLAANRLDRGLFDVTELIKDGYDDAARDTLPVMVDYGKGATAAAEAKGASLLSAERTVVIPTLGIAAFHADKKDARAFWADLTTGADADGNPTKLSDGATHVDLDGKVKVSLEDSVPQIHAPEAWAAGYDGKGSTVAILDTGIDLTHPDFASGLVVGTANFTDNATFADGNGHGTHVASTIAGDGAASGGLRKGVAPGTHLLIGKVLADAGYGEDSWVLAGMQWAVDQHADVVSMSLGGDSDDGSHPLSQAVNELSAGSDTLFVIAAGNNGSNGPSTVSSPGSADAALTVGAVDVNNAMAPFSSRGPRLNNGAFKPEVVAPGVDVTAARATGTDLGGDLATDPYYTTISGTSMATPHVAGLAAILKGEHPAWDGERLKAAIANSTVPIADATGFDAGTGRIDALKAIHQTVFAAATLELGNYSWPYGTLAPSSKTLTYTNDGDAPVTLVLSLDGEDGGAEPTGSMSLSAHTLVVPAGGQASVDVTVDPTIAPPGAYSAVVTATVGDQTVRTGVAYQLESERYDVKVTIKPRAGTSSGHQLGLSGFADPWVYEQRTLDASPDAQTVTFRLPPGTYGTGAISSGLAADGAHEGVVTYMPSFTVDKNTEIVLDENDTKRFDYEVGRPVIQDGAILDVGWDGDAGHNGFMYYGSADRVYARPSAGLPGTTTVAVNWLLSQPEGVVTPAGGSKLSLRQLAPLGGTPSETPVTKADGSYRLVDLGDETALADTSVRGAIAVVAGHCDDLTATAQRLRTAKAVALVAYAAPGEQCAGQVAGQVGIPTLEVRPYDVAALLAGGTAKARLLTHKSPGYMYDLVKFYPDSVPAGATLDGTGSNVAAVVETYKGLDTSSGDGLKVVEELYGWVPARGGVANIGLVRRVPFPSTVTHYVSTSDGVEWERTVEVQDAQYYGEYARLWGGRSTYSGGSTTHDTWFGGPIGLRVSPTMSLTNGNPPPVREICVDPNICAEPRDEFFLSMGAFTDAAGHLGHSDIFSSEYVGSIYADGKPVLENMFASVFMNTEVPAGKHRFKVVTETKRQNLFWQLSTDVKTVWGFTSDTPKAPVLDEVLPMLGVDYQLDLSSTNTAAAGRYDFGVSFSMPNGLETLPVTKHSVEISWDGGTTWKATKLSACDATSCQVRVTNKAGGSASLRVKATDAGGRTVKQTIVDAYVVR